MRGVSPRKMIAPSTMNLEVIDWVDVSVRCLSMDCENFKLVDDQCLESERIGWASPEFQANFSQ